MSEIYFLAAGLTVALVLMILVRIFAGWRIWKLWKASTSDTGERYNPEQKDSAETSAENT